MLASSTATKTFGLAEELFLLMDEILHDPGNSYDLRAQAPRQGFEYLTASLFRSVDPYVAWTLIIWVLGPQGTILTEGSG